MNRKRETCWSPSRVLGGGSDLTVAGRRPGAPAQYDACRVTLATRYWQLLANHTSRGDFIQLSHLIKQWNYERKIILNILLSVGEFVKEVNVGRCMREEQGDSL